MVGRARRVGARVSPGGQWSRGADIPLAVYLRRKPALGQLPVWPWLSPEASAPQWFPLGRRCHEEGQEVGKQVPSSWICQLWAGTRGRWEPSQAAGRPRLSLWQGSESTGAWETQPSITSWGEGAGGAAGAPEWPRSSCSLSSWGRGWWGQHLEPQDKGNNLTKVRLDQVPEATSAPLGCVTPGKPLPSLACRLSPLNGGEGDTSCSLPIGWVGHQDSLFSCFWHRQSMSLAPPASKTQGWKPGEMVPISQTGKLRLSS